VLAGCFFLNPWKYRSFPELQSSIVYYSRKTITRNQPETVRFGNSTIVDSSAQSMQASV
jgi:hypothetical protein